MVRAAGGVLGRTGLGIDHNFVGHGPALAVLGPVNIGVVGIVEAAQKIICGTAILGDNLPHALENVFPGEP